MADAIVSLVLRKIGEATYQEALKQYNLGEKGEWAKRELNWVSAFLKDAEAKQNKDERVKQWVKEVREVTYMIEDALDNFLVDVGRASNNSKKGVLEKACKLPNEIYANKENDKMMSEIKKRMSKIRENCEKLKIMSIEGCGSSSGRQPIRSFVIPEIDITDIVGFKDVDNICNLLLHQSDLRRSVISIVGAGSRGKTTIATKVYNSDKVERHFESRIWLTISSEYRLIDVLKKMLQKLWRRHTSKDQEYLIKELHNSLKEKNYLIVLDDVWSTDLWNQLHVALPEDNNGSRVLITTRDLKVAESVDLINDLYQLRNLDEDESTKLLLKTAFPNQFVDECPNDLLPLVNQFSKNCAGSPLALVVLGGILSTKRPDYITWDEIMSKLNCNIEGNWCMNIISTSYDDLPVHLKPCFMYFAMLPEDGEIGISRLIRMWIAEGFIQKEPTRAMEDTAINYLEELVQRCIVQVTRQSRLENMRSCRIHYILHELAIKKARENDFLTVYSNSTANSISTFGRRVAYREFGVTTPKGAIGPNLRSLVFVGSSLLDCEELRMTRVLDIQLYCEGVLDLKWLQHIGTTLRYLRFDCYMQITNLSWLAHLKHLQILEIYGLIHDHKLEVDEDTFYKFPCCNVSSRKTDVSELPSSFWDNKMLRSVIFGNYSYFGPPSSANLENLLKLKWVVAREEWFVKLPHFPRIRKLVMYLREVKHSWEAMSNSMSKLENLASLSIEFPRDPAIAYPIITPAFAYYKQMHSLTLHGKWPKNVVFDGSLLPPNLVKLVLRSFDLRKDPMSELEKLPHLRLLVLMNDLYWGEKLSCSRGGFRCLQQLELQSLTLLKELKIEEGAMPMLNVLAIRSCGSMKIVPDLQYLKNLRKLKISGLLRSFVSRLNGEEQHKINHIPSIIIDTY